MAGFLSLDSARVPVYQCCPRIAPPVVSFDACMKLSVDDVLVWQVGDAREEHRVDMDLCSQLLHYSLVVAMVLWSMRLKWVRTCAPVIMISSPRESNTVVKGAWVRLPGHGSPTSGDGEALVQHLTETDATIDDVQTWKVATLKLLFKVIRGQDAPHQLVSVTAAALGSRISATGSSSVAQSRDGSIVYGVNQRT